MWGKILFCLSVYINVCLDDEMCMPPNKGICALLAQHFLPKTYSYDKSEVVCSVPLTLSLNLHLTGKDSEQAGRQPLGQTQRVTTAHGPVLVLPLLCRQQTVPGLSCLGDVVSHSLFLGQRHRGFGCFSASWGLSEVYFPPLTQTEPKS